MGDTWERGQEAQGARRRGTGPEAWAWAGARRQQGGGSPRGGRSSPAVQALGLRPLTGEVQEWLKSKLG